MKDDSSVIQNNATGNIRFTLSDGQEVLRFEPNGKAFVRGELVTDNFALYEAFKGWLETLKLKP